MSIKNYLRVIIVFLIITPLIILSLVTINLYSEIKNKSINNLIQETTLKQFVIQTYLQRYIELLNILSANISLTNNNYEKIYYIFKELSYDSEIENLYFINPDGYSYVELKGPHHISFINNKLFQEALSKGKGFLIEGNNLNSYLFISKSVYTNSNQISGIVLEVVKLTKLEDILNIKDTLNSQSTFLFSKNKLILGDKSKTLPIDLSKKIDISSGSGLINYKNEKGKNFILFWKSFPNLDLSIASQIDENYIFEEFEKDFTVVIITFLIIFITSLIISIIIVNKLKEPINFLQDLSQRVRDQNFNSKVDESFIARSPKEFQPLLRLYNQMSASIENYISKLNEKTQALEKSEARYKAVVEDQVDLLCRFEEDGTISFANTAFKQYFGITKSEKNNLFELLSKYGTKIKGLIASMDEKNQFKSIELELDKDGTKRYFEFTFRIVYKDDKREFQCTGHDITEIKKLENELRYQSFHDSLTGLLNRAFFEEELERMSTGRFSPTSLIIADLDNLKLINDTLGHEKGDLLLKKAANILQSSFRSNDIVARIGGDEFAVLLPLCSPDDLEKLIKRLKEKIENLNKEDAELYLSMSIGFATKYGAFNKLEIFREADSKMYLDKESHHEESKKISLSKIEKLKDK